MIYSLTLNASLDYLAFTDSVKPGEIHKINEYELYPGGKGINVSQVLSSLGVDNVALGYVAGVTGESLCQLLEEKSIKQDFIKLSHGMTRINVKMRHEDIETDFNAVGPLVDSDEIEQLIKKLLYLNEDDILIISGSFPKGIGEQEFEKILDQSAGLGLFIFSITQKVADMPSSVIANSGLIFAGKISRPDDVMTIIRKIGREERYDDRDILKWFPRSPIGWFVCRSSRNFDFKESEPVLVKVDALNVEPPTNYELETRMLQRSAISLL